MLKRKNPYEHITDNEYNRFIGSPLTDYIVTGVLALLFCTILFSYFDI